MSGERKKNKITIELYPETAEAFRELDPFLLWHKPRKEIGESIGNAIEHIYFKFIAENEKSEKLHQKNRDLYGKWRSACTHFDIWLKDDELTLSTDYYEEL